MFNPQRFTIAAIAVFLFIFMYDWVVHGQLMMNDYNATPALWRPKEGWQDLFPFMLLGKIALTLIVSFIFTRHYEGKGIGEGLRFGIYIGTLVGVVYAMQYIWLPISGMLAIKWFLAALLSGIGQGIILSLIYTHKNA